MNALVLHFLQLNVLDFSSGRNVANGLFRTNNVDKKIAKSAHLYSSVWHALCGAGGLLAQPVRGQYQ